MINPSLFPLITAAFTLITVSSSYTVSVLLNHVSPIWPMISDTGTFVPESCIFGLFLNATAAFGALTIILRYFQVSEFYNCKVPNGECKSPLIWTVFCRLTLIIGLLAAFGISLVANFQETNVKIIHGVGAIMIFGLGSIYLWCHVLMSYLKVCRDHNLYIAHSRLILAFFSTAFLVYYFVGLPETRTILRKYPTIERFHWSADQPYYGFFLTTTYAEWLMGLSIVLSLLSYAYELKNVELVDMELKWNDVGHDVEEETEDSERSHLCTDEQRRGYGSINN